MKREGPGTDDARADRDGRPRKPYSGTLWPWMLPEARHARYGDGAWLAALRSFWADRYEITIRRRWFRKEWLAVRKNGSGVPLRARDHTSLSQAMYAGWLAETALVAHARAAAEEAAAAERAAPQPVAVFELPPDEDCVSPATMTRLELRPGRARPYVPGGDAS